VRPQPQIGVYGPQFRALETPRMGARRPSERPRGAPAPLMGRYRARPCCRSCAPMLRDLRA